MIDYNTILFLVIVVILYSLGGVAFILGYMSEAESNFHDDWYPENKRDWFVVLYCGPLVWVLMFGTGIILGIIYIADIGSNFRRKK